MARLSNCPRQTVLKVNILYGRMTEYEKTGGAWVDHSPPAERQPHEMGQLVVPDKELKISFVR